MSPLESFGRSPRKEEEIKAAEAAQRAAAEAAEANERPNLARNTAATIQAEVVALTPGAEGPGFNRPTEIYED